MLKALPLKLLSLLITRQLHTPFAAEKQLGDLGAATCCRASSITKKLEDPAARQP